MPYHGSNTSAEFGSGVNHTQNAGRDNFAGSLTLNDSADDADQGLDSTSARWNSEAGTAYTPHSVLAGLQGMSGNGMSQADAGRLLPGGGQMESPNGSAEDTYGESSLLNRVYGEDA